MRKLVAVVFAFALLVNVSGCGMKGESEAKEGIQNMNDLADAMEKKDRGQDERCMSRKRREELNLSEEGGRNQADRGREDKLEEKYKADTEKAIEVYRRCR